MESAVLRSKAADDILVHETNLQAECRQSLHCLHLDLIAIERVLSSEILTLVQEEEKRLAPSQVV